MDIVSPTTESVTYLSDNAKWKKPTVFGQSTGDIEQYPIDALPSIIRNAVSAYQQYGQQPLPLIACSALANVSLACQTLGNVARDKYLVSPISLYFLSIAGSGDRKSGCDYMFSKSIRQWQLDIREQLEPEIKAAQTLHNVWLAEKKGLLAQIRRNTLLDQPTDSLQHDLHQHIADEPTIPISPVLFFEDTTQEALASHISSGWPSTSLWSDEGALVVGGHGMQTNSSKFIALLNRLWDGKPFIAHRKTSKSFTVANRRLTISLMMQPIILEQMLAKNGGISRHSGFLARSLIAYPKSEMGNRFYQEPPNTIASLPEFHKRLTDCLEKTVNLDKNGCHDLPTIALSPKAKIEWVSFFNQVEAGLKNPKQWRSIKDFASKAPENAARLAALFHLFDGNTGDITAEKMDQAITVIRWHLKETRRVLGHQVLTPKQQEAQKILSWMLDKGLTETSARELQQFGPVRNKHRRDLAIAELIEDGCIQEIKENNKKVLLVNPHFYD